MARNMIRIYYGSNVGSEEVAVFYGEATYMACFLALEKDAKKNGWEFVWESVVDDKVLVEELADDILEWRNSEDVSWKVTTDDVDTWIGQNGLTEDGRERALLETIRDVANGDYKIQQLNSNIKSN